MNNNQEREYPYLQDSDPKYNNYSIRRSADYCAGGADKWCELEHAGWMRETWHHKLNWESPWDKKQRLAYEALVSQLLLEDKVF